MGRKNWPLRSNILRPYAFCKSRYIQSPGKEASRSSSRKAVSEKIGKTKSLPYYKLLTFKSVNFSLSQQFFAQKFHASLLACLLFFKLQFFFSFQGDLLASADAYGHLILWDVRNCAISTKVDLGPHAINKLAFDPGSNVVACASNDGLVKVFEIENEQVTTLTGHEDAVQTVIFDRNGEFMLSGGSDSYVKVWS